jgi:hypothetical protein
MQKAFLWDKTCGFNGRLGTNRGPRRASGHSRDEGCNFRVAAVFWPPKEE